MEILTKTCFSPQSEPHRDKLCFSVALKHLWGNSQRISLLVRNWLCQKGALKYSEGLFFLTYLERGISLGKFGFV